MTNRQKNNQCKGNKVFYRHPCSFLVSAVKKEIANMGLNFTVYDEQCRRDVWSKS